MTISTWQMMMKSSREEELISQRQQRPRPARYRTQQLVELLADSQVGHNFLRDR
jgi:hypothetical protein